MLVKTLKDNSSGKNYWRAERTVYDCARTKFAKNETFTAHQFHERCGIGYDTADKYLPLMSGKDLGEGLKILRTSVAKPGYVLDPPGDDSLKAAHEECCRVCGCDQMKKENSWLDDFARIILGGFVFWFALKVVSSCSEMKCVRCGSLVDLRGLREPSFNCPTCGTSYVRSSVC